MSSSPAGISCGTQCADSFPKDTQVVLEAIAADGSRFTGWGAACTGTGPCTITLQDNRTITANFETTSTPDPTLTVNRGAREAARLRAVARHLLWDAVLRDLPKGTTVALSRRPATARVFAGWDGERGAPGARVRS